MVVSIAIGVVYCLVFVAVLLFSASQFLKPIPNKPDGRKPSMFDTMKTTSYDHQDSRQQTPTDTPAAHTPLTTGSTREALGDDTEDERGTETDGGASGSETLTTESPHDSHGDKKPRADSNTLTPIKVTIHPSGKIIFP